MRLRAILGLQTTDFPHLLERGKSIHNGFQAHPELFVTPRPSLLILKERIDALDTAQQLASTRVIGAASARTLKASELVTSLETSRAYVQELADAATPENAATIIESAAMRVARVGAYSKPFLRATQSSPGSPVRLQANVGALTAKTKGKVFFNWQYCIAGDKDWADAPSTPYGVTDLGGLKTGAPYSFRVSVTDAVGTHPWSQTVTVMVY